MFRGNKVKLQRPTDFLILKYLDDEGRNVAPNIAEAIGKSRSHVNVRLPMLEDYGLVRKIGPAKNSGLYEINESGRAALRHEDSYGVEGVDFEELIREDIESGGLHEECSEEEEGTASA